MESLKKAGLVLALLSLPMTGCGVIVEDGNGKIVQELREVSSWRRIDICCGMEAEVTRGANRGVMLEADQNLLQYLRVQTRGDELTIDVEPMTSIRPSRPIRIVTSTEELVKAEGSGGSRYTISGFDSPVMEIELSGGSRVELTGTGRSLEVEMSGGSELDARGFPVENADVDASGGSIARLSCSNRLTGELSGGSRIFVDGRPSQRVKTSGGSRVVLE